MKVVFSNVELSKREIIKLTRSECEAIDKLKEEVEIHPDRVLIYDDENNDGETVRVMTIEDDQTGRRFNTTSPYFIEEFMYIHSFMTPDDFSVRTMKRLSKNNKEFNTCEIV